MHAWGSGASKIGGFCTSCDTGDIQEMPRFFTGDELGNIKSICYAPDAAQGEEKTTVKLLRRGSSSAVQVLATSSLQGSQLLAAGFSDGSCSALSLRDSDTLEETHSWKEMRLREGHRYIGLEVSEKGVFTCTSNGALRSTVLNVPQPTVPLLSVLPTRLHTWKMSPNQETFAYGGNEVDISVWETERAFSSRPQTAQSDNKKRKRDALFPAELWRAKNVNNDNLGLRQPLCVTSLTYLTPSSDSRHLATGTELGNVHRYDIRAARRPVSGWKVGKTGGIKSLEKGMFEHELFVSDQGSNFLALDLRNGQVTYSYKGLSGAVTSIAPSPSILGSAALDRYVRIHSTFAPPQHAGQQQERKGEVLEEIFMKNIPTVIVWDQAVNARVVTAPEDDDVWETLEIADGYSDDKESRSRKRR